MSAIILLVSNTADRRKNNFSLALRHESSAEALEDQSILQEKTAFDSIEYVNIDDPDLLTSFSFNESGGTPSGRTMLFRKPNTAQLFCPQYHWSGNGRPGGMACSVPAFFRQKRAGIDDLNAAPATFFSYNYGGGTAICGEGKNSVLNSCRAGARP